MSFTIASWNVESRLSNRGIKGRGSPEHIVDEVTQLNADMVVLLEAYDPTIGINTIAADRLRSLYPTIIDVPYNDEAMKKDMFSPSKELITRIMTRLAVVQSDVIRLANKRNTPVMGVVDPGSKQAVTIFPIHFDDKLKSRRMTQIDELAIVLSETNKPIIMMGDFNTSTGKPLGARLLRWPVTQHLMTMFPSAEVRDKAERAIGMASGDELRYLESKTGLIHADPTGKATTTPKMFGKTEFLPAIPFLDIDHMYHSPSIKVTNFAIMDHDGGADHRALSATVTLETA